MANGLLMFAKYAFPPNTLQLCGPQKGDSIFEILTDKNPSDNSRELEEALLQFEGAVPYLRLIAQENNIKDIFDERVVEAYWLGNSLLNSVSAKNVYSNIENRFKKAMNKKDWLWLVSGSMPDGKPFHGFHVFDVYRRAGLLRSGNVNIRWTTLITSATQNISAGNWYFGFFLSNTYSNNGLGSILCWGNNQNISNGVYGGPFIRGVFSTTTNAMPASIHTSNMNKETTNETTRHPYILIAA